MSKQNSAFVNFIGGGVGAATGAFVTCPLDVVQTRLQSSVVNINTTPPILNSAAVTGRGVGVELFDIRAQRFGMQVFSYMRHVVQIEGFFALYKGLVPTLAGVVPSRAIYFTIYEQMKHLVSNKTSLSYGSPLNHVISALTASWSLSTLTNPIWFMKTRLQLDLLESSKRRPIIAVTREVFRNEGLGGFYRGLSASYMGASETIMFFVIYEQMKKALNSGGNDSPFSYGCGAFVAKAFASITCYPHEVARTRLRQESLKLNEKKMYSGFVQTLAKVYRDEGWIAWYGGMGAHLMKQLPNTIIMFLTYETVVKFLRVD